MRLICQAERALYASLVRDTRCLIGDQSISVEQVVDELQRMGSKHEAHLFYLRRARDRSRGPERIRRLNRLIAARQKAAAYLAATIEWITDRELHPFSLRQRPRILAMPAWRSRYNARAPIEKPVEYAFMDFSS